VPTVVVVDDEVTLRRLVRRLLESAGHEILEAEDGLDGYELIRARQGDVDLVITDIVMPRMRGTELVRRLEREYPK
jgi:CheY-like chemotaxis protein